ncbi:MAG: hypothetical protein KGZ59_06260 [Chitinophagaceae bacterium]|nr:hypothetical protein [Chitinophagaceae bacterium]
MKFTKKVVLFIALIITVSVLYRVSPLRDYGFAPQLAIALFSGYLFSNNKKWAFILPLMSMFLSDVLYEVLYNYNLSDIKGFYGFEQVLNYSFILVLTGIGFFIKKAKVSRIASASIAGPTVYFLISNFAVWAGNGGYQHPKTLAGLIACMTEGLPFYKNSLVGTLLFSTILFGSYFLITKNETQEAIAN